MVMTSSPDTPTSQSDELRRAIHNEQQKLSRLRHPLTEEQKRVRSEKKKEYYRKNREKIIKRVLKYQREKRKT